MEPSYPGRPTMVSLEMPLKIAAVQFRPPKGMPEVARAQLTDAVQEAASAGAELIVCPEMATTGYVWSSADELMPFAETPLGPTHQALQPLAVRYRAWVVCGYVEREGAHLYNAALVIGPSGRPVASYRKCLLYTDDIRWSQAGEERLIIDMGESGKMMPAICMDLNDDGLLQAMRVHQPRFLAFSTNWVNEGVDPLPYWQQRLAGWTGWFIAANSWGEDGDTRFTGLSTILGPDGRPRVRADSTGDQVLIAETDDE